MEAVPTTLSAMIGSFGVKFPSVSNYLNSQEKKKKKRLPNHPTLIKDICILNMILHLYSVGLSVALL